MNVFSGISFIEGCTTISKDGVTECAAEEKEEQGMSVVTHSFPGRRQDIPKRGPIQETAQSWIGWWEEKWVQDTCRIFQGIFVRVESYSFSLARSCLLDVSK